MRAIKIVRWSLLWLLLLNLNISPSGQGWPEFNSSTVLAPAVVNSISFLVGQVPELDLRYSQAGQANPSQAQPVGEKSYLDKLFGGLGSAAGSSKGGNRAMSAGEWLLAIPATLFYGQLALLVVLGILFTRTLVAFLIGLIVVSLIALFVLPRPPRPVALFVLACLNLLLAAGITLTVAFGENVLPVLISLLPLAGLVWLAFPKRWRGFGRNLNQSQKMKGKG